MNKKRRDLIHTIAAELVGTAKSLDETLRQHGLDFEDLSRDDCGVLDDNASLCDICGWWHEPSEMAHEGTCLECQESDAE